MIDVSTTPFPGYDRTRSTGNTVTELCGEDDLDDLKRNIFNGRIWPDFSRIPTPENIFIMHIKPQYQQEIDMEIRILENDGIEFLKDGEVIGI